MGRVATELRRKSVYMATGLGATLLRWLSPVEAAALAVAVSLLGVLAFFLAAPPGARARERASAVVRYSAAIAALVLVFRTRLELAAAVWALTAFGNGMATVAGVTLRGPRLPWNPAKTWWGFLAFALYGTSMSALLIRWVQHGTSAGGGTIGGAFVGSPPGSPLEDVAFVILGSAAAAVAAALAESLDVGADDSVLVPVAGGAVLYLASLVEPARLGDVAEALARSLPAGVAAAGGLAASVLALRGVGAWGAGFTWLLGALLQGLGGFGFFLLFLAFSAASVFAGRARDGERIRSVSTRGRRTGAATVPILSAGSVAVVFAFLSLATARPDAFRMAIVSALAIGGGSAAGRAVGARAGGGPRAGAWRGSAGIFASLGFGVLAVWIGVAPASTLWIVPACAAVGLAVERLLEASLRGTRGAVSAFAGIASVLTGAAIAIALASTMGR